jgi:hypothetical protein
MVSNITLTNVFAYGYEDGLSNRLEYATVYECQIIAKDNHDAMSYSLKWWFLTDYPIERVEIPQQTLDTG